MKRVLSIVLCLILALCCNTLAETKGEKNALASAKAYLNFMNFSYKGLCDQLSYEGFTSSECKYAADNCGADWYEQAAGSAKAYLSFMAFSKQGLIDQLVYEGYTKQEAEYGAAIAYGENPTNPNSKVKKATSTPKPTATPNNDSKSNPLSDLFTASKSVSAGFDFSNCTDEELLLLETALQSEKIARGMVKKASVAPGKYVVGNDIPAGNYRIETEKGNIDHLYITKSVGASLGSYSVGTMRSPIGKLELHDGDVIEFYTCTLTFIVYTGGIVFE